MERMFDYRQIPEFSGTTTDEPVIQWIQRIEMICDLCKRTDIELILQLCLQNGALAVYQQLNKKEKVSLQHIEQALIAPYAPDLFNTYGQIVARRLRPDEAANEYLADLQQLDLLIRDREMACDFVSGLSQHVRRLLRASTRMNAMTLEQLVARVGAGHYG